jgi:site-specific DNA-methyltransferase (adenine-specific)
LTLAIVDPPYGIDRNGMNMGNSVFNKDNKKWDNNIPSNEYFNELFRVSKNKIIWGGNYFPLPTSQYFAIWDKGETMYGRDFAECEFAWVQHGGTRIYKKSPNQPERIHPTQKPVALYKWLLDKYAKPTD